MTNPGDEAGILLEFLYARTRGNTAGWDVVPMPCADNQEYPCFAFNVQPHNSVNAQGGDTLFSEFLVNFCAVGGQDVDDLEPLRGPVKEVGQNLLVTTDQPGLVFASGRILSCTQVMPLAYYDRSQKGQGRWYVGARWLVKVQPDGGI